MKMRAWAWANDFGRWGTYKLAVQGEADELGLGTRVPILAQPYTYIDFVTAEDRVIAGIVVEALGAPEDVAAVIALGRASLKIGEHTEIALPIWRVKRDFATPLKATAGERIVLAVACPVRDYKAPITLGYDLNMAAAYPLL
jgi:hypothetical protein